MKEPNVINVAFKYITALLAMLVSLLASATPPVAEVPPPQRTIYIDTRTYQVDVKKYGSQLDAHARYLIDHLDAHIRVQGSADERHSREYSLALGQRAAESVKTALTDRGVNGSQIVALSFGEERPVDKGHDERAWAKNRRVEIVYLGE